MKKFLGFVLAAVLASGSVCCTTGDYPGDEGQAGNAGSAGASGSAGTAGSNQLPPGGGSGGSGANECGFNRACTGNATCNNDGSMCCGGTYRDPASPACTGNTTGGSGGSAPTCGFNRACTGNGTCAADGSKCCGGVYRDPNSTACTGNGQGGSGGSNPTCGFGMVCSGSVVCSVDNTLCCGGVYRDPSSLACNPNQGTGANGGSSGGPTCGIGKSCSAVNGSTCAVDGSRCCNGVYVDKQSSACGFNNEQGTATGTCTFHAKAKAGAGIVHIFIQGAGVVDKAIASLEGGVNSGPVSYAVSSPPVEWHTLGNCDAVAAKGQSLDMTCTAPRSSICGSAKNCALAFQAYAVRGDGSYSYACNDGASDFEIVQADCDGNGYTTYEQNGSDMGKHVPKYSDFDLTSKVCVE